MNQHHLLLMLHDGARKAEQLDQAALAAVLHEMTDSLAASLLRDGGPKGWRTDEVSAIFVVGSEAA